MAAIKFGTDGWRAVIAQDFTFDNLSRVTEATALWLLQHFENPSVMVGYDCRFNGQLFAEAVANQLAGKGIKVFLSPGFVSTPMVSLATLQRQANLGVIITASHNPPEYSGFKLKGAFGGPAFPATIAEVEALIPDEPQRYANQMEAFLESRQIEYYDMEALYMNQLKQTFHFDAIRQSAFKIGYDAMYGAGQNVMKRLFPHADLLHCDFNPSFLGQAPEPIEKNLLPFQALIREKGIHFGLATDGDADRIGLFDEQGEFVDSHHILLMLIHYLHKYKKLTGKVVFTFSCTDKIRQMCELYGLPYDCTKIGFKYIGQIMANENVLVGGEESGGIAVAGHAPERDGVYIGLTILEQMALSGKKLTELVQEIYAVVGRFSVQRNDLHLTEERKQAILALCKSGSYQRFGDYQIVKTEDMDGYKFRFSNGFWVMIRPSGTEPVLRIYAEGETKEMAFDILEQTVKAIL